ncbi:MAG: hypothetical protein IJ523_09130 [Succinivibrionaceae bacterium]|nr:hypothetical protein [Succinivibrionaceae bacterium]
MIYYFDETLSRLTDRPPEGSPFGPETDADADRISQQNTGPGHIAPESSCDPPDCGGPDRNAPEEGTPMADETLKEDTSGLSASAPQSLQGPPGFAQESCVNAPETMSEADFCDLFLLEMYVQNFLRPSDHPEFLLEDKLGFAKVGETDGCALYRYEFVGAPRRIDLRLSRIGASPMNGILAMTLADERNRNEIRLPLTEKGARYMLLRLYADASGISEDSMVRLEDSIGLDGRRQNADSVKAGAGDLPPVSLTRREKLAYLPPEAETAAILSGTPFQSRKKTKTGLLKILLAGTTVTAATSIIVTVALAFTVFRPLVTGEKVQLAKPALRSQASQLFWASGYPKQQVDLCIVHSGWENIDQCSTGNIGKDGDRVLWDLSTPSETYRDAYPLVESVTVKAGKITVTARSDSDLEGINFILTPERNNFNHVRWIIDPASTCRQKELC